MKLNNTNYLILFNSDYKNKNYLKFGNELVNFKK